VESRSPRQQHQLFVGRSARKGLVTAAISPEAANLTCSDARRLRKVERSSRVQRATRSPVVVDKEIASTNLCRRKASANFARARGLPGRMNGGSRYRIITHNLFGGFILAQSLKRRMPQMPIVGPIGKHDLRHQLRL
jgi:hypothetical protein